MTHDDTRDDPELAAMLRAHTAPPPMDDVDWAALHARTRAAGAGLLQRRARSWWHVIGRDFPLSGSMAAAAAVALLVTGSILMPERPIQGNGMEFRTIEEELAGGVPFASVPLLAQDAGSAAVIDALLLYDEEEW